MYAQAVLPFPEVTPVPATIPEQPAAVLYPAHRVANSNDVRSTRSPKFIRSVVEEAGLGRFVYMYGLSGRRYVFSPISAEQAGLYDHAVFAHSNNGSQVAGFATKVSTKADGISLYVHLLSDDEGTGIDVIADLAAMNRC